VVFYNKFAFRIVDGIIAALKSVAHLKHNTQYYDDSEMC